ncbi:hypothetical protein N7462_005629 [Penicillium macrosclerotiorum]|uniref:uncharacterized protein n=1 Tax=Penicillium macrosclerotiorum TaxID=303699 RepID=UPI002547DBD8|nr:uncharacterized protein N7462_005629 [Penicillium macrosclerotiorum]KAJ5682464.1 hypothetical protein N7462_005629 [Penicillium macrosclerotiorum]
MQSSKAGHASARIANETSNERVNESVPDKILPDTDLATTNATHLSINTQPSILRTGGSDFPVTTPRIPEGRMMDDVTRSQHFTLRTLPAWIRSVEDVDDDVEDARATDRLLPSQPNDARVAQHNHSPYATSGPEYSETQDISLLERAAQNHESRWKTFSRTIQYPREYGHEAKEVTPDWMNDNHGSYLEPWRGKLLNGDSPEHPLHINARRREVWIKRFQNSLLKSPIVPLILRLTVWCFSLSALALGGSIQHLANEGHRSQGPSALMAIIVDAVALVYLVYITFDEYTSKPLGLRSPSAKARLILLDLFFIVFDSANLSLAFASLSEVTGSCTEAEVNQELDPRNDGICVRQKALASVLLVALLAWLMTFCISVLR